MKDDSVATTVAFIFFILFFLVGVFCPVPDWYIGVFVVGLPITIIVFWNIVNIFR